MKNDYLNQNEGLFCDLLWSDPSSTNGWTPSNRGISQTYGPNESEQFLLDNSLKCIIRGHELVMNVFIKFLYSFIGVYQNS